MHVWKVIFEQLWDFDDNKVWDEGPTYNVTANSYDEALRKAEKLALSKDRGFRDDGPDGDGKMHYIKSVRPVHVERGEELDA